MISLRTLSYHFIIFCFLFSCICYGQRKQRVNATGISISNDLTPKQGEQEALKEAKIEALRKAGIKELLSVSSVLFEQSRGDSFSNFFNEISTSEMLANIVTDSIFNIKRSFDEYGNMIVKVEILATIFKSRTKKDYTFFFEITGLREVYYESDYISFSFLPSKKGYLKIFAINELDSYLLYPFIHDQYDHLSDKGNELFMAGEKVEFPIHQSFKPGYSVELEGTDSENTLLIFVYTKSFIPWLEDEISLRSLSKWIYNIPVDQRVHSFRNIIINSRK